LSFESVPGFGVAVRAQVVSLRGLVLAFPRLVAVIPYRAHALVRHGNPLTPPSLLLSALWTTARFRNGLTRSETAVSPERTAVSRWARSPDPTGNAKSAIMRTA